MAFLGAVTHKGSKCWYNLLDRIQVIGCCLFNHLYPVGRRSPGGGMVSLSQSLTKVVRHSVITCTGVALTLIARVLTRLHGRNNRGIQSGLTFSELSIHCALRPFRLLIARSTIKNSGGSRSRLAFLAVKCMVSPKRSTNSVTYETRWYLASREKETRYVRVSVSGTGRVNFHFPRGCHHGKPQIEVRYRYQH